MERWPLPRDWEWVNLANVTSELESGARPRGGVAGFQAGIPSIGGEHLTIDGGFDFNPIRYVPETFANSMKRGWIKPEDILIVKDGATTGKTSFVGKTFPFDKALVNEHVFRLRSLPTRVEQAYLFWFLYSALGQEMIRTAFRGSAQGGINQGFVKAVDVPVAPMPQQSHIVARLNALTTEIAAARALIKTTRDDLTQLLGANVNEILSKEAGAQWLPLRNVATAINGRASGEGSSTVRVFKTKHVYSHRLKMDRPSHMKPEQIQRLPKDRYLKPGDVLMANIAEGTLGRVTYVQDCEDDWTVDTQVMIIRSLDENVLLGKWLYYYLWSERGQEEIIARRTGIAFADKRGQTHIYPKNVLEIPVPIPITTSQRRYVAYLDSIQANAEEMQKITEGDAMLIEELEQSILVQAFRGAL